MFAVRRIAERRDGFQGIAFEGPAGVTGNLPAGYGKVSGQYYAFGNGSILEIVCESADKAKLTQAKYLSDLQLLPGVQPVDLKNTIHAWKIEHQGAIAAVRLENKVLIVASSIPDGLEKLIDDGLSGSKESIASSAEVQVPMWLDHWDKYGFRLNDYDVTHMYMPEKSDPKTFDFFKCLEWLHSKAKMGLAVDPYVSPQDYAEGISCEPYSNWVENAARELNVAFSVRSAIPKTDGAPIWLVNRCVDSVQKKAPFYVGGYYMPMPNFGWGNNSRTLGWYAGDTEDQLLAEVQQVVRRVSRYPNLVSYHYPQQEVDHGRHDLLLEWGPAADASYQKYLRNKIGALENLSRRWHGSDGKLKRWEDARVPELAEFGGWGPDAVDIGGEWKVKRLAGKEEPPAGWEKVECPDSGWETVRTPGDGMLFGGYKERHAAVFRIRFAVTENWIKSHSRQWLYVWDLNPWDAELAFSVNGKAIARDKGWPYEPHWMAIDVTGKVGAGLNQLALLLSQGYIGYRVYLSGEAPENLSVWGRRPMPVGSISWIGERLAAPTACGGVWRRFGRSMRISRLPSMPPIACWMRRGKSRSTWAGCFTTREAWRDRGTFTKSC